MNFDRPTRPAGHVIKGSVVQAKYEIETYKNLEVLKSGNKKKYLVNAANYPQMELDLDFLPAAAESYHISADPRDYILVPLPIVTVDVPNRNLQGFPLEEVTHFDPVYGQMVYQTFQHKPTHVDHVNDDPTQAKGVHVDVGMRTVAKYDTWKIHVCTIWDRTKDQKLVQDIIDRKRTGYSMGATVIAFHCSICGKIDNLDASSCQHMKNIGGIYGEKRRLAYQVCTGVCYFETSSVADPADPTAWSEDVYA